MKISALPAGWSESHPGGLASNPDPVWGGIIDKTILAVDAGASAAPGAILQEWWIGQVCG
jgi:hypothetical protein